MNFLRNESGTAALEGVITASAILAIVVSGLIAIYLAFARVWIGRSSYEALICLATSAPKRKCEQELRTAIRVALPVGAIHSANLSRNPRRAEVDLRFEISGKILIRHRDSVHLPIKSGKRRLK